MNSTVERSVELVRWIRREHHAGRLTRLPGTGERELITLERDLAALSDTYLTETRVGAPELVTIGNVLSKGSGGAGSVSPRTVARWAERGLVRAEKHGKTWMVDPADVAHMIKITEGKRSS